MSSQKSSALLRAASTSCRLRNTSVQRQESLHGTTRRDRANPTTATDAFELVDNVTCTDLQTKSMNSLPGPPGWPIIGNFVTYLKKKNHGKIHHVQAEYHKKFGKIFREKWGPKWQVHVSDPDLMEYIYRHQGQYPNRPSIQAWNLHRKINDMPTGLVTSQGEEWYRIRSLLDKKLLSPSECTKFFEPLSMVTNDYIKKIQHMRDTVGDETLARGLPYESYKWGVECAGMLLFDRRLGCLDLEIKPGALEYIDAFNQMLSSSMKLIVGEKLHQKLNTKIWQQHSAAWDKILSTAKKYCQEKIDALEAQKMLPPSEHNTAAMTGCPFHGSAPKSTYLSDVIASGKLTLPEVFTNFSEIMFAAADTTSNTVCFLLHMLATNPEAQHRLYTEISDVTSQIGADANPVGKMTYLDAVLKETFRLYPLVTMQCRILDDDITLGGYHVPKDTMFVLNHFSSCRDPDIFEDPEEFRPERWFRNERNRMKHHPFAAMPFGYGKRTCLGKRFARLELHMAITKIMQKFEIRPIEGMEFDPEVRTILTPGKQVPVRFVDR